MIKLSYKISCKIQNLLMCNMNILCLVFCFGAWLWQDTHQKNIRHRIVNGEEVSVTDYPYQVSLEIIYHGSYQGKSVFWCGGTLISRKHILTATHCFNVLPEGPEVVRVLMGSERSIKAIHNGKLQSGEQSQCCRNCWINHPKFDCTILKNDISIITLPFEVKLSFKVQPISLPKSTDSMPYMANKTAVVSGWGLTENRKESDTLRAINITLTDHNCPENSLCYIPVNNKSDCKGDSGGPIVMDRKIVGIVSHGKLADDQMDPTLCEQSVLSVYTSVANYLDWIQTVTQISIEN